MSEDIDWGVHVHKTRQRHLDYYLAYAQANAERDPVAYDCLESVLPNLLLAVDFADRSKVYEAVRAFSDALYSNSNFLDVRGYSREALDLLKRSINACREIGDRQSEGDSLGSLGSTYHVLGELEKAIDQHQQAACDSQFFHSEAITSKRPAAV